MIKHKPQLVRELLRKSSWARRGRGAGLSPPKLPSPATTRHPRPPTPLPPRALTGAGTCPCLGPARPRRRAYPAPRASWLCPKLPREERDEEKEEEEEEDEDQAGSAAGTRRRLARTLHPPAPRQRSARGPLGARQGHGGAPRGLLGAVVPADGRNKLPKQLKLSAERSFSLFFSSPPQFI